MSPPLGSRSARRGPQPAGAGAAEGPARQRAWWGWLAAIAAVGLAVRVGYVLGFRRDVEVWGDAFYYHWQGRLVAEGKGFLGPAQYVLQGRAVQAADHPPLYVLVLAAALVLGGTSFLAHQLTSAAVGAASVLVVGLLGREVAGERAGLVAAALAAVYPYFWVNDGQVMSETVAIFTAAVATLAAYRFGKHPRPASAVALGAACGLAALSRAESVLLLGLVALPLALLARPLPLRRRVGLLAATGVTAAAVVAPWVAYNLSRFERPVYLSSGLEITLTVSNCDETYRGQFRGFWFMPCVTRLSPPQGDQSEQAAYYRRHALDYVGAHRDELSGVVAARLGRAWGLYRPTQQLDFDVIEGREKPVSVVGLGAFYLLCAGALAGTVVLRRRRVPVFPLAALAVVVSVAVVMTFGNTRYRAPAEVALVVLSAVALSALGRRREPAPQPEAADEATPVLVAP